MFSFILACLFHQHDGKSIYNTTQPTYELAYVLKAINCSFCLDSLVCNYSSLLICVRKRGPGYVFLSRLAFAVIPQGEFIFEGKIMETWFGTKIVG